MPERLYRSALCHSALPEIKLCEAKPCEIKLCETKPCEPSSALRRRSEAAEDTWDSTVPPVSAADSGPGPIRELLRVF